jgi:hypothetical protein
MSDLQTVVSGAKAIEKVLVEEFGAKGRGLYANMASSRIPIPQAMQRRIRYVAAMRNKSVHELRFDLGDPAAFTERCARLVEELRELHTNRQLVRTSQVATQPSGKPWAWGMGAVVVLLLIAGGYLAFDRHGAGTPTPPFDAVRSTVPAASPASSTTPPSTDPAPSSAIVAMRSGTTATVGTNSETGNATNTEPGSDTSASTAPASTDASTGYYGVADEALRIEAVTLHYQKNALSRQRPLIELSVRNTSAATLSHVLLDARLFINDGAEPVLINGKRRNAKQGPLYAGFGAAGLAAGEIRVLKIYAAAASDWGVPEVRNAKSRRLALQVAEVSEGGKH